MCARRVVNWFCVFGIEETGLATIEWVALAGAVIIGAVTVAWVLTKGLQPAGNAVGSHLNLCESSAPTNSGSTANCL